MLIKSAGNCSVSILWHVGGGWSFPKFGSGEGLGFFCASAWLDKAPSDRPWSVVSADVCMGRERNVGGGAAGGDVFSNGANFIKKWRGGS